MSTFKLLVTTEIKDKNGKILKKTTKESRSFVLQWLQVVETLLAHAPGASCNTVTIKDTSNVGKTVDNGPTDAKDLCSAESPANNATYGILAGTGTTAPTNIDYTIETAIAHGVGAGQLQHGATVVNAAAVVGANVDMTITKQFTNGSGNTITVKEVGIVLCHSDDGDVAIYLLIVHDAVDDAVANAEIYTATYTFRTTV